jgi:hypothetical protein
MPFAWVSDDESVGAGFLRIAREQLDKALAAASARDKPAASRIHEVRRRTKKLRGLLRLVRPDFPTFRSEDRAIRDVARVLADARDERVLRQALADLFGWAEIAAPTLPPSPEAQLREEQALAQAKAMLEGIIQRLSDWPTADIDARTLRRGLAAIYRAGRKTRISALSSLDAEDLHEWRKLVKYHATQLDLLATTPEVDARQKEAASLGTLLGTHHDLAMLSERLAHEPEHFGRDFDRDDVGFVLERRRTETEAAIAAMAERVFGEKTKHLVLLVSDAESPPEVH